MELTYSERKLIERALYKYRNLLQEMHAEAEALSLPCKVELAQTANEVNALLNIILYPR
jgi:hypothetical protein